jgi:hypothetical protein
MKTMFALALAAAPFGAGHAQDAGTPSTPTESSASIDPARLDAAQRLIGTMNIDDTLDRMFVSLAPLFADGVIGRLSQDPQTEAAVDNLVNNGEGGHDRLVAILSQEFMTSLHSRYPQLKKEIAREYAVDFTAAELDEITAFYSTGTGAKVLRLMPEIQKKIAAAGEKIGQEAGQEAGARAFDRAAREMLHMKGSPAT